MDYLEWGLPGLFLACFLAATLLPLPSEAVLLAAYALGIDPVSALLAASVGNVLGGTTNYALGYWGSQTRLYGILKPEQEKFHVWNQRVNKWGAYLGLISWVPFIGDPMVLVLGFFRVPFWKLLFWMSLGKFLRYLVISLLYWQIF